MLVNPNSGPITQTWKNGVKETLAGGQTTYQLPTDSLGVAREFTVTPRFFGLFGSEVVATDAQGRSLETRREWHGAHRVLVAEDPTSGLVTRLDAKEQVVEAGTAEERRVESKLGNLQVVSWQRSVWQTLDGEGQLTSVAEDKGRQKETHVKGVPIVLMKAQTFLETHVDAEGNPTTSEVAVTERGCQHGATLPTQVKDGRISVSRGEGSDLSVPLYFAR